MANVSYLLELTIDQGQMDPFKDMARNFVQSVHEGEPGTLTYQWRIREDGQRCLVHERFASSEALLTHLGNAGPTLPGLFAIAPFTRFEVFGPVSQEVRAALADFGVQYFPDFAGFDR